MKIPRSLTLAASLFLIAALAWPPGALSATAADPLEAMKNESYAYDVAFLWFNRLAQARLSFFHGEKEGTYRAVLEAQTLGLAATVTRDRSERHSSLMERLPDGRLRSLVYESQASKGRGKNREDRTSRYVYDYDRGEIHRERVKRGQESRETFEMPEGGFFNDVLTAFYNFRAGYFGEIVPGGHYRIPTFSRKGPSYIIVDVYHEAERPPLGHFPRGGLLCRVEVDQEIFDTDDGAVFVWFDGQGRPARGMVENVLSLGDVRGTLR